MRKQFASRVDRAGARDPFSRCAHDASDGASGCFNTTPDRARRPRVSRARAAARRDGALDARARDADAREERVGARAVADATRDRGRGARAREARASRRARDRRRGIVKKI